MKSAKASLLLHPVFIISLILLFLNDFYWKYEYGNWLTGKLSDVAGLIIFPIFLSELFRKFSRFTIIIFAAFFFAWWKSPLSQFVIDFFNQSLQVAIHRTVDYTDLFAMLIFPFVFKMQSFKYNIHWIAQRSLTSLVAATTIISLCSTSYIRRLPYDEYTSNAVRYNEEFCWPEGGEDVLQSLRNKGLIVSDEPVRYYPLSYSYRELFYRTKTDDSSFQWKPISSTADSIIYVQKRVFGLNYIINEYSVDGKIFRNIRFSMNQKDSKRKRTCVTMISLESDAEGYELFPDKKHRKQLKKYFEALFDIRRN